MTSATTAAVQMGLPEPGDLTEQELLRRLAQMVPVLRERAAEAEELRRVPDQTVEDARASGFLGAFRPLRFDGPGLGLSAMANGARVLAHGCTSSAWTLVFLAQHVWMVGKMPPALQDDLLADGEIPLIAGALAAIGTATRVDGGYLVSGRSEWNSAIAHSQWTSMKARVEDEVYSFYLPVAEVDLKDVWHTSGMRGTSSDSFEATDVFVPEARAVPLAWMLTGDSNSDEYPFAAYPYISVVSLTCSAVVLGAAEAAVELFEEKIRSRVLAFSGGTQQVEQPFAQMRLGEVSAKLRMAREQSEACIRQMDEVCGAGGRLTVAERVGIRASCALVVHTCRELVSTLMASAGGSSYFLTAPLQRIQRDVEVLKSHAMFDWDRVAQLQGRVQLGMSPEATDLV
ncbi:MAG: ribA [Acidimicrobiales bacterium]|nr:ribA [Acidimicrobiales bacterium]